jgi:hypothetical protein
MGDMAVQKPTPEETDLVGWWVTEDGITKRDAVETRIYALVEQYLEHVADSSNGWGSLYRDPLDGRLWELSYPHSEMHGGGPARLTVIDAGQAKQRYQFTSSPAT